MNGVSAAGRTPAAGKEADMIPESCADCAYFRYDTFPGTAVTFCLCERAHRAIPDEDRERPDWCPFETNPEGA